eukprot:CAMPEP_0113500566 /NCGR_PEP_ID=MMETSP0014_2-20120614/32407_1 /TAXON_ID=2857 /ORGANISM="Nitzschia sp." /LENGTH=502 /DNA_ID=CAMNT_0000394931 /DNA_START=233 /DNA_END=1741 /DNA_ORIENTATION=+ /assembly_acc=CAM_ASM_000159
MEVSPTSPSSYLAAQRLPIISRPTDGAVVGTATQPFRFTASGIATVPPTTLASAASASASAAPTMMTAILPSSSSVGSGHGVVVAGGNNSAAANNAVAHHVTPEMIKQPILLTFSAAEEAGGQQPHSSTQGSPHQQIGAVPITSTATSSAMASFSKVKALPTIPDFPAHGQQHGSSAVKRCSTGSSHFTSDSSQMSNSAGSLPMGPPNMTISTPKKSHRRMSSSTSGGSSSRLNKFVRRLHDMLVTEKDGGIVEWRRGLLVLYSTTAFTKSILPKYFNTKNFKTFRRQLNYYGFVHVRSFSATGSSTTALWINQNLARDEANEDVSAVLKLHRVEPNDAAKTVEGRRVRKEKALFTVEEDIGLNSKKLQLDQIRTMAIRGEVFGSDSDQDAAAAAAARALGPSASVGVGSPPSPRHLATMVTALPQRTVSTTSNSCDYSRQERFGIPHEVQIPREQRSLSIISDRNSSDDIGCSADGNTSSSKTNLNSNADAASLLLLLARS